MYLALAEFHLELHLNVTMVAFFQDLLLFSLEILIRVKNSILRMTVLFQK